MPGLTEPRSVELKAPLSTLCSEFGAPDVAGSGRAPHDRGCSQRIVESGSNPEKEWVSVKTGTHFFHGEQVTALA